MVSIFVYTAFPYLQALSYYQDSTDDQKMTTLVFNDIQIELCALH